MSLTSIPLDADTLACLDAAASARALSREETVRQAIYTLNEYDQWFAEKVQEGRGAVAHGDVFTQGDIESECAQLAQEILQRVMKKATPETAWPNEV